MKVRWLLLGSVALAVGGALLLSHLLGGKDRLPGFTEEKDPRHLGELPPLLPESEYDGIDFLT